MSGLQYGEKRGGGGGGSVVPYSSWVNAELTGKLQHVLLDPVVVASGALPFWSEYLVRHCSFLFPLELRRDYLESTAFGVSRAIHWLQDREANATKAEAARRGGGGAGGGAGAEGRERERLNRHRPIIGTLNRDRVCVSRAEVLQHAEVLMAVHAGRKARLEIKFEGEPGVGEGIIPEFFAKVRREVMSSNW